MANEETTPPEEGVEMQVEGNEAQAGEPGMNALEQKVQSLNEDLAKAKDALLRTAADFDNFRKRQRREMEDNKKFATEKVLLELLPALDNLQRALAAAGQGESQGLVQGVKMVADQFKTALENHGLKGYESVGQKFDPQRHEAISEREEPGKAAGTIVEEFQKGYMLHDRVVRPAMVVVAKGEPAAADKKDEETLN